MAEASLNATSREALESRIAYNVRGSSLDLNSWIFERMSFPENAHILELCAGTGSQSIEFLRRLGTKGKLFAVDISADSLRKIAEKASPEKKSLLSTIPGKMEEISELTAKQSTGGFDICFCAYGLYYSHNPEKTLSDLRRLLNKHGRIVVVGPYGKNNSSIFRFLEDHGVKIAPFVKFSSNDFMKGVVVSWAIENVARTKIYTAKNEIVWKSPEEFINYWKNSTFFDNDRLEAVSKAVSEHFRKNGHFVVDKHIMMVEMEF